MALVNKFKKIISHKKLLLFMIVFLALALRLNRLGTFPSPTETHDEYAWTFLGASLIQTHYPISWSYFPYPNKTDRIINGNYYPIVKPVMDHPPLFSLFPGSIQTLAGEKWDQPIPIGLLRISMLPLALINVVLIYQISTAISNYKNGLLSALLYATLPSLVFTGKLILAENLLITLLLLQFYLAIIKKTKPYHNWLLLISSILAVLSKISGIIIPIATLSTMFFLKDKRWKYLLKGTLLGVLLLFLYASFFDLQLFLKIQFFQSKLRFSKSVSLIKGFILNNKIGNTNFFDPVMLTAKISMINLLFKNIKKTWFYFFSAYACSQIGFILISVGEKTATKPGAGAGPSLYGWYFYPLLTLATIAFAFVLYKIITNRQKISFTIFNFLVLPVPILIIDNLNNHFFSTKFWITFSILLILLGNLFLKTKTWDKFAWIMVTILIASNIYVSIATSLSINQSMNQYLLILN